MGTQSDSSKNFFDEEVWEFYNTMLDNNYLFHKEFYQSLHNYLLSKYSNKKYSLLDLGCGDSACIIEALRGTNINYLVGIDSSKVSLQKAIINSRALTAKCQFFQEDFVQYIQTTDKYFDVIFLGFTVHHLPTIHEKQSFISACIERLKPNGALIIIDIICDKNESQKNWYKRYVKYSNLHHINITPKHRKLIYQHVDKYDFPESISTYESISKTVGVNLFTVPIIKDNFYAMMVCEKLI